ncbi:MAG: heavy-metal-associated domain-containing protein [Gemmatimonadaceae bacterium]
MHLDIGGMSCGSCVGAVKTALSTLPGVSVDDVHIGSADVSYDPDKVSSERISEAVRDAGYDTGMSDGIAVGAAQLDSGAGGCRCC